MPLKAVQITVHGRVQGVTYRATARKKATELGVHGIVRNNTNGTVYMEAEGDDQVVSAFIEWCHHGPGYAHVTSVEVAPIEPVGRASFEITH